MNDIQFKQLLDKFDQQFSEEIYTRSNDVNWTIPSLQPTSFIVLHEKTFTDDLHFIQLIEKKSILIKGNVQDILNSMSFSPIAINILSA